MRAHDFRYDNKLLSDFGFIVCKIDDDGSVVVDRAGSKITLNTIPLRNGVRNVRTGSKYEECLSATFRICKNPEWYDDSEMEITTEEFRALSRWLSRNEFLWFRSFDLCTAEEENPWFHATFSLSRVDYGSSTVGIELTMTTDSPFGYGDEIVETLNFTSGNLSKVLIDENDEIGETYPEVSIKCKAGGNLSITDDVTQHTSTINNCSNNEVITMSGDTLIITTSLSSHDIANDFNYTYFCFGNSYDNRENTITASIPCEMTIRYRPTWKDAI